MKGEFATTHMEAGAQKELRARIRDPRIFVGRGTYGAPRFVLYSADDRITIGRYCSIAECAIMGGGEHNYKTTSTFPFHWYHGDDPGSTSDDPAKVRYYNAIYKGPTKIGCDVWIGFGATILSGVTIGHGAVIGAAAVVASDVPPFAIMVGNPARALRKRFDDATIDLLLDIQWWNWKPEYIYEYQGLLFSPPEELFAAIRKLEKHELAGMYEENPNEIDAGYQAAESAPPQVEVTGDAEPAAPEASTLKKLVRNITPPVVYSALYRLKH